MATGPGRTPLVIVVLLTLIMAGCTTLDQVPAMEARDLAEETAEEWNGNASLTYVVGIEGAPGPVLETIGDAPWGNMSVWERASEDDQVGDGRAEAWLFLFTAEHSALDVVVDKHQEVVDVEQRAVENPSDGLDEPCCVGSDEVAAVAVASNQAIERVLEEPEASLLLVLDREQDRGPLWRMMATSDGQDGGVTVVDARSGQVLSSHAGTDAYPR